MFSLNSLSTVQLVLIGIGVAFQFVAFSALRKAAGGPGGASETTPGNVRGNFERQDLSPNSRRKTASRPSALRWKQAQDFYEMEKTPTGIRPGELPKTAKVAYFDGVKPVAKN